MFVVLVIGTRCLICLVVLHFTALCILHCALLCELNDDDDDISMSTL